MLAELSKLVADKGLSRLEFAFGIGETLAAERLFAINDIVARVGAIGLARISEKRASFMVNNWGARPSNVLCLVELLRKSF